MISRTGTRVGARLLGLMAGLFALAGSAQAATVGSGPLRIADLNAYACAVANVSSKPVAVEVNVIIDGGAAGSGATNVCPALAPNAVCTAANDAGSTNYRTCVVTTGSKRALRGTFCNVTTGICVPVQ